MAHKYIIYIHNLHLYFITAGSLSLGGTFSGTETLSTNGGHIGPLLDDVLQHGVSSTVPNSLPSLIRVESGNQSNIVESGHPRNHPKFELQSQSNLHPHSLPEYHDGLANGPLFGSPSNIATNGNIHPPEISDGQQFRRITPNGQSIELNEGNNDRVLVSPYLLVHLFSYSYLLTVNCELCSLQFLVPLETGAVPLPGVSTCGVIPIIHNNLRLFYGLTRRHLLTALVLLILHRCMLYLEHHLI